MADEEPVDPKKYLEERCKPQCVKPLYEYEKCIKRVEADDTGHKHCTGQYFDYWSCIDKCVAPKLFEKLNDIGALLSVSEPGHWPEPCSS